MSMLNFKYGAFANLPARSAATNGTIYITTDEQAMYVDLDNQRIRLSQIITLSNAAWQALTPPYSTEAFYYIYDANALLKYSGTAWVQLNSKKDLQDALAGLGFLGVLNSKPTANVVKGQICTVGNKNYIYNGTAWADCGLVGAEILDLQATVASHTQTLATHTQDITDLKNKDTAIEGDIALLKKGVGYTGSGATLPAKPAEGDIFIHSGTIKVYCKNPATEKTAAWHAVGNVSKRLEDLRARVEVVAAAAGDKSDVEKLQQDLADLSQTVVGITAASLGVGDFKNKTVAGIKQDFTGSVADGNTGFTTGDAVYDAIAAAKTAVLGQANYGQTVKSAYEAAGQAAQAASGAQATADAITQGATSLTTLKKVEEKFAGLKVQDLTDAGTLATDSELAAEKTAILGKNADNTNFSGTVKGAYENASAASQAAAGAQATADAITKDATTLTTLKKVEEKFAGLTVSDLTDAGTLATDNELAAAKTAVLGQENGKDFAGTVKGAYANASTAQSTANTAKADAKTANDDIAAIKNGATITTFKGIEQVIANLGNTYATDKELSDGLDGIQGNTTKTIKDVEDITGGHATRLTNLEGDVEDIREDIVSKMQAADAMEYKGTINVNSSGNPVFPTSKVSIGHTYKAIAEFTYNGTAVYVGDLLIAKAKDSTVKEDANGHLPSNGIAWDHIPSGYVADYNPKMKLVAATNSVDVNLTSAHANTDTAGDLGDFQISGAAGSSITVAVQSGTNNIAIGMTWGKF